MAESEFTPAVAVHYGIPSTASILAFDSIQRLLAVATLDGRIKVVGGDNVEGFLMSPKTSPFKNLQFFQNQGFLVSVSNENEIQVWDLEKRSIACSIQWESNITAFSVIYGTNYMYAGDEYGFLSVLKYDVEQRNILQLPYHMPPNLFAEGAGITVPDHQSIVGVLPQPFSCGNRVLIAYGNGLIILWDVTEDKAIHVKGNKDLEQKESVVINFSNNKKHVNKNASDEEETEKEISSLCWVSADGSFLAVGYVDGDILLWDLSVSDNGKSQRTQKLHIEFVKIQLSSGDRRLPVIVLHWSSNKTQSGNAGQLFVYGGEDIGSEEVLTILDLDWSSGLAKLKCIDRVDLRLHGSFADLFVTTNSYEEDDKSSSTTSLLILTNPGQLHFSEYASLSTMKSDKGKNHMIDSFEYRSVIPTVDPYMTIGKLYTIGVDREILEAVSLTKDQPNNSVAGGSSMWHLTGASMHQNRTAENKLIERVYIGGYEDGSVRIWDATLPVLSLFSVFGQEVTSVPIEGSSTSVSALNLCIPTLTFAVGNECGLIFLYSLGLNSSHKKIAVHTESKHYVHHCQPEERNNCSIIYSILKSPVRALQFTESGAKLLAGFECGKVMVLDTGSPSVLLITDSLSGSSPIVSLAVKTYFDTQKTTEDSSDHASGNESAKEIAFVCTRNARLILMDTSSGNILSSHQKENLVAINLHLLGVQPTVSHDANQSRIAQIGNVTPDSLILLCCEEVVFLYTLKSLLQGDDVSMRELKLEKPCSWTTVFKKGVDKYELVFLYQTGEIEMRTLPEFEKSRCTSSMSTLRWNFKNNMDRSMSASDKGLISMVNGNEFALLSLSTSENELRIPESLPCLHDKVLATTKTIPKKHKSAISGFVNNIIKKGLKGSKSSGNIDYNEARGVLAEHLERIFSRFPFSDSYDLDETELGIDDIDIDIDEPVLINPKVNYEAKETETDRQKLFEGGSSDDKPRMRTREEIIAKYRKPGDAASAASQAKDKLLERQEKLERLSRRTEELQSGAENFASMAHELAKTMEKRKWWNL